MTKYWILPLLLYLLPASVMGQSLENAVQRAEQAGLDRMLIENVLERAASAGVEQAEAARLIAPAIALAEQDLPATHVVQRALEGLAKRVPPDRITHVMKRLQHATEQAGQVGDPWLQKPDVQGVLGASAVGTDTHVRTVVLESLAQAFMHEVPREALNATLERLPAAVPPGRTSASAVGAALQILPDLPVTAHDPDLTAGLLAQALNSGFAASDLRRLPGALQAAQQRGELPAETVARGALYHMAQGTPAATVLESLFQGQIRGQAPGGTPPGLERRPGEGRGGSPNQAPGGGSIGLR